ncbi:transposase [Streptomyces sp. NPDC097610]|uniref:transposase n=1 Tax=Streptomyces sp. NPDC097610 TaxID=3157227 RepID=UPI003316B28F
MSQRPGRRPDADPSPAGAEPAAQPARQPDRSSETSATWLSIHPGVEIVCRDRATAYTRAIKEAAPHALEIADRWHLLQNLSSAVEKTCHQHRGCLRKRLENEQLPDEVEVPEPVVLLPPPARLSRRTGDRANRRRGFAADFAQRLGCGRAGGLGGR